MSAPARGAPRAFDHVETWVFELDNTLYPPHLNLWQQVDERIRDYIANFLKTEPWDDWRRTGFPIVPLVPQAVIATLPQRIRAPNSELSSNSVQVAASGIPTGEDGMVVKLWWAGGDNR